MSGMGKNGTMNLVIDVEFDCEGFDEELSERDWTDIADRMVEIMREEMMDSEDYPSAKINWYYDMCEDEDE